MSKVLVMVTTDDAGDEGSYNGSVIGSVVDVIDGEYSDEAAIAYVQSQLTDEDREEMEEDDNLNPPKLISPHPYDSSYISCVDLWGVIYHFMKI